MQSGCFVDFLLLEEEVHIYKEKMDDGTAYSASKMNDYYINSHRCIIYLYGDTSGRTDQGITESLASQPI